MENNATSYLMPNYGVPKIQLVRGAGVRVFDDEGREYLDFTAGIAVSSLGHGHPDLTAAIATQAQTLLHTSNLYGLPERERLAQRLCELSGLRQVFFCNSGTEATEAALKLARRYAWSQEQPDRTDFVSLPGGFHGRTFGSLSVTPKPAYHEGFQPLLPGAVVPPSLEATPDYITETTAACVVEVIQGEGGVWPVPHTLLQAIERRCRDTGALLVVDEVQTGVGRTGSMFAFQTAGIHPDIMTLAKGLGGGAPIGAVLATGKVATAFQPGTHGSTFGGNPVAVAAAQVVLNQVSSPGFLERVQSVGRYLQQRLEQRFAEVTGQGLMWGFTVSDADAFVESALQAGLLVTKVGPTRIRMVPPLIVSESDVDEAMERISTAR